MPTVDDISLRKSIETTLALLRKESAEAHPNGHDLLNALHTVLCTIEMLEIDITASQRDVFERLEISAQHLELQMQVYIKANSDLKRNVANTLDGALRANVGP